MNYLSDLSMEAAEEPRKALQVGIFLKDLEKTLDNCKELIREALINEVNSHGKNGATAGGYVITVNPGARRWKYHGEAYEQAKKHLEAIQEMAQLAHRLQRAEYDQNGVLVEPAYAVYDRESVVFKKAKANDQ